MTATTVVGRPVALHSSRNGATWAVRIDFDGNTRTIAHVVGVGESVADIVLAVAEGALTVPPRLAPVDRTEPDQHARAGKAVAKVPASAPRSTQKG